MRLIIPAAGSGIRLGGGGNPMPKLLVPISGRPIVSHLLRMVSATGAFSQIVIILGPYYESVLQTIQDLTSSIRWQTRTDIICIRNSRHRATNNIYSLYLARDYLEGDILVHDSDVLVDPSLIIRLISKSAGDTCRVLLDRISPIPEAETKAVVDTSDRVTQFGEDVTSNMADGRYVGVCSLTSRASDAFRREVVTLVQQDEMNVFYTSAIKTLAGGGTVQAVWAEGLPWFEIDTLEDLRSIGSKGEEITRKITTLRGGQAARFMSSEGNDT